MQTLLFTYEVGMLATFVFSSTAILAINDHDIDLFGAFCLGILTAIGGGTVRDLILGVPIFWTIDQSYIWMSLFGSILTYFGISFFKQKFIHALLLYLDGLGAALFCISTTRIVWALNFSLPIAPVMLGLITAIGGGILRDVLVGRKNLLLRKELYAIPIFLGSSTYYILLTYLPQYQVPTGLFCIALTFSLRAAAIHWKLSVPHWLRQKQKRDLVQ